VSYSLSDLKALPRAEQVSDFHCVTGWSVYDVRWVGVRLQDVLAEAGALPTAGALRFVSDERPYDDSLTLDQAFLPDVMLAYEMDGKPLSRPHGAPVRLVMPQMYGYKSVKWVTRMEVKAQPQAGFWEQHGYDADAWIGSSNGSS
jgi:DMSO/TMAO reductase YedYZ molybdopterin-dependent catalytic subunit